jgi:hypothetical protein
MAYLFLGSDVTVHSDDVIGIFDIERVTVNKDVNEFLKKCQKSGKIYYVSLDLPKSFIVADERVYVSNVCALTIKKRCGKIKNQGKK